MMGARSAARRLVGAVAAWPTSPDERLLFAGTRLRVIRTALWVGWLSLLAIFALTILHSRHIERAHHVHIWMLLGVAAVGQLGMHFVPWKRLATRRVSELVLYGWVGSVIAFVTVLRLMAGPFSTDFFLVYLPLVLFAAAAFPGPVYTAIVAVVVAGYLGIALVVGLLLQDLILRVAVIVLVAALAGYLAREQRLKARSIALLHEALLDISGERDDDGLRRAVVAWARRLAGADVAALLSPGRAVQPVVDPPGATLDPSGLPLEDVAGHDRPVLASGGAGAEGAVLVPVGGEDVLVVRGTPSAFSTTEQYLLETLAAEAAVTLETLRLHEGLRERERARADLLRRLVRAEEEERRRLARELHDRTSQDLAGLVVGLEALERAPETVDRSELKRLARQVAGELRRVTLDLRPRVLDDLGLAAAIRWLAHERHAGMDVDLELPEELPLPPPLDIALFRIIQEALANVERHARASRVRVAARVDGSVVRATVVDDGAGFDPSAPAEGLGLLGMRERAEQLGGVLRVASAPGRGTRVEVELPLGQPAT